MSERDNAKNETGSNTEQVSTSCNLSDVNADTNKKRADGDRI